MQLVGYNGTAILETASYNATTGILTVTISHGSQIKQASVQVWTLDA